MSKEIIEISSDSSPSPSPARARAAEEDVKFRPLSFLPTSASVALYTPLGIEARAFDRNGGVSDVDDRNVDEARDAAIAQRIEIEGINQDDASEEDYESSEEYRVQSTNWFPEEPEEEKKDDDEEEDRVQAFFDTLRMPGPAAGPAQEQRWRSEPSEKLKRALANTEKKPQKKKKGVTTAAAAAASVSVSAAPDTGQKKKRAWTPCRWVFENPEDPASGSLAPDEAYKRYKAAAKTANRAAKDIWPLERFISECFTERFMKPLMEQNKRQRGQQPIYVKEDLLHYEDFDRYYKTTRDKNNRLIRRPKDITDQASLNAAHERYWAGFERPKWRAPVAAEFPEESPEPQPEYGLSDAEIDLLENFERRKGNITRDDERTIEEWKDFLYRLGTEDAFMPPDEVIAAMFRAYIKWKERN
jgi:hypothetical protein